jgi:hypothetical protein
MRGFILRLLKVFLTGAHLLTKCLGIDVGVFHLGEHVLLFLRSMGRDLIAQFAKLFIVPSLARLQIAERLDRVPGFFLIFRRFLQYILFAENFTHGGEKHIVLNTLMNREFISDLGDERALFIIRSALLCDGVELVK